MLKLGEQIGVKSFPVAPARPKTRSEKAVPAYGAWHFARDALNHLFGLINTGRIIIVVFLVFVVLLAIVLLRTPPNVLPGLVRDLIDAVRSSTGVAYTLLLASNFGWLYLLKLQRRLYQDEIDRMAAIRKQLMHGEASVLIKQHRSSDGEQREGYILPSNAADSKGANK